MSSAAPPGRPHPKQNKAFWFINYEGRRDASSQSVTRNDSAI